MEEGTEDMNSVTVFLCQQLIIQVPEREGGNEGELHGVREGVRRSYVGERSYVQASVMAVS